MTAIAEFEALLKRTMGLDAASIGSSAVERAVQSRLAACELPDRDSYWARVSTSEAELQELIEAVVVPETWFFRDREAFVALAHVVREEWLPAHPQGTLRLLSVPCSTGEEPYSMAIKLREALVPPERLRIDAIDISTRALERARRAVYGRNSFRGDDLGFRDRHFESTAQGWRLADADRQLVHFAQGNLLTPEFRPGADAYDMIFCRNVLIYFDRATQEQALSVLARWLAPDGVIFVGPSETGLLLEQRFVPLQLPRAFAFRKPQPRAGSEPAPVRPAPPPRVTPRAASMTAPIPRPRPQAPAPVAARIAAPAPGVDEVRRLADAGRLPEALALCRANLSASPSAEAFYLLGVISDALAQSLEAAEAYRRAIYLDPRHREAMVHLASLLDRHGDGRGAQVMRERARRLENGK